MENFTAEEILKLEKFKKLFNVTELAKEQLEGVLDRKIEPAEIKSEPEKRKKPSKPKLKKRSEDADEEKSDKENKKGTTYRFHVPNIFRKSYSAQKPYRIEKVNEYRYEKFKNDRFE